MPQKERSVESQLSAGPATGSQWTRIWRGLVLKLAASAKAASTATTASVMRKW
ncbi:MAG: hypothetical protein IPM35_19105 [Myxococcales bacterium]|nr:hypothetical protein [Myxococcales bacterium]